MKNSYKALPFITLFFCFTHLMAQPGGGGKPCPKPPCPPPVPITGIEYLIGLGGLYGAKRLLSRSRNKEMNNKL